MKTNMEFLKDVDPVIRKNYEDYSNQFSQYRIRIIDNVENILLISTEMYNTAKRPTHSSILELKDFLEEFGNNGTIDIDELRERYLEGVSGIISDHSFRTDYREKYIELSNSLNIISLSCTEILEVNKKYLKLFSHYRDEIEGANKDFVDVVETFKVNSELVPWYNAN